MSSRHRLLLGPGRQVLAIYVKDSGSQRGLAVTCHVLIRLGTPCALPGQRRRQRERRTASVRPGEASAAVIRTE
jgi:hypothetical protein